MWTVRIEKLVRLGTKVCLVCDLELESGYEVRHYKVAHHDLLIEIAKRNNEQNTEEILTPNPGGDGISSGAPTIRPQVAERSNASGTLGLGQQQRPLTDAGSVTPSKPSVKQEWLPSDGDAQVVVTFELVKLHGEGYRLLIHDTKDLSRENVNALLSLLVPPERTPAANACPRLKFEPASTGGTRIEVKDTGLLTATQLAAVRRVISGTTEDAADAQPQGRTNIPFVPQRQLVRIKVPKAAKAKSQRQRKQVAKVTDPNAPKKARTSYAFFVKDFWARTVGPRLKPQKIMQAAACEYNRLKADANAAVFLAPFRQQAEEDKERYETEFAQYLNGL